MQQFNTYNSLHMNVLIHAKFLSESFPIIVEYEEVYHEIYIDSVRLIRRVINGEEIYGLTPVYEAALLFERGLINFLSSMQHERIKTLVRAAISGPHTSIPEDQIVEV